VEGLYPAGAPELIVEVALSGRSRDFGAKKRLYERTGVEYLIAVPVNRELVGFSLTAGGFQPFETNADGVFRSRYFPGLWLDTKALWDLDRPLRTRFFSRVLILAQRISGSSEGPPPALRRSSKPPG
jgi:Uma2 family endonuclease